MNWSAADVADVPPRLVTATSTVPVPAGDVAVIDVAELTVKLVASACAELDGRCAGESGAGDRHRRAAGGRPRRRRDRGHRRGRDIGELVGRRSLPSAAARGHPDIDGAGAGRDVAVIEVAELTVKLVAAVAPNYRRCAGESRAGDVTVVPPAVGPDVGEIDGDGGRRE